MSEIGEDLLSDGRERAGRLLSKLNDLLGDLEGNHSNLSFEQIEIGRAALLRTIECARRTIDELDEAIKKRGGEKRENTQ